MFLRYSVTLLFILINYTSQAQKLGNALADPEFHNTLIDVTSKFDRAVLADTGTFWNDNMKISGIGFVAEVPYNITITFQKDTGAAQNLGIFRIGKTKVKEERLPLISGVIDSKKVVTLSDDSLNIKAPHGQSYAYRSDGRTWTLISVQQDPPGVSYKQSYMPAFYQKRIFTADRKVFIESINAMCEMTRKK